MATVTGTILTPDGEPVAGATVAFSLVGATHAWRTADDDTIANYVPTTTDENGEYTITLVGNPDVDPGNTRYRRSVSFGNRRTLTAFDDEVIVPTGAGTYTERQLLVTSPSTLPEAVPTNDLDSAYLEANFGPVAVNLLTLTAVPALVVDVPDSAIGTYVKATAMMSHSLANAAIVLVVAPVGATVTTDPQQQVPAVLGAAGTKEGVISELYLPPHSAGQYQAFVLGTAGNLTVEASSKAKGSLVARSA